LFPSLIHFFGPDGAGKSTQVEILIRNVRRVEARVRKCWVRSPHTLAFLLWRLFVKIGFYRGVRNVFGVEIRLPAVDRSRMLRLFWELIEFFSVLPLVIRIRFLMWRGYKFVAERYLLDSVATVAFFVNDMGFLRSRVARLFLMLIPRDAVFIFLDSDFETIFRRRAPVFGCSYNEKGGVYGKVPKSAVEPREFIDFQRVTYKVLAKSFNAFAIDTSKTSVKETSDMILEYLRSSNMLS